MSPIPLVLIPGLMCDQRLWQPQIDYFAGSQTIIVADVSKQCSIADMAVSILSTVQKPFILAGLSMGGIVAFEVLRQAPEQVLGLALLDTNAKAEPEERKKLRFEQINAVHKGQLLDIIEQDLMPKYLAVKNQQDKAIKKIIIDMAISLGEQVFERQSHALMGRQDSMASLANISCPTEVLCGEDDALCPVETHTLIADRIPHANLTVVKECGHMSTLEDPHKVNSMLSRLIERVESDMSDA